MARTLTCLSKITRKKYLRPIYPHTAWNIIDNKILRVKEVELICFFFI